MVRRNGVDSSGRFLWIWTVERTHLGGLGGIVDFNSGGWGLRRNLTGLKWLEGMEWTPVVDFYGSGRPQRVDRTHLGGIVD